jgi:hypothetical protein
MGMSINQVALLSGIGVAAVTAAGTLVAHEALEHDGEWTSANGNLAIGTQLGGLGLAVGAMGIGGVKYAGIGGGLLFGSVVGNFAGIVAAQRID